MTAPKLIIFGSFTLDNVIAPSGAMLPRNCGGNVVYAAAGAALWTSGVGIVAPVGADYPADFLSRLADRGLDLGGVRRFDAPHGMNVAFWYRPDGSRERRFPADVMARIPPTERARYTDYTVHGPDHRYSVWFEGAPVAGDIPETWIASATGAHAAALPVQRHIELMRHLRARREDMALNVDSPWFDERTPDVDFAAPLFAAIDTLLPSEADLAIAFPGRPPIEAARALIAHGARRVVIKLGAAGSAILERGAAPISVPTVPVAVADPTGAGDAYCGGFLAGLVETGNPLMAAAFGTVSASVAVETIGPLALLEADAATARLRLAEILKRLGRIS